MTPAFGGQYSFQLSDGRVGAQFYAFPAATPMTLSAGCRQFGAGRIGESLLLGFAQREFVGPKLDDRVMNRFRVHGHIAAICPKLLVIGRLES